MATNPPASIFIGSGPGGAHPQALELKRANRHGLIAGATGTGKTVTLQGIVEGLSDAGVPTFVADVKGDLADVAMADDPIPRTSSAVELIALASTVIPLAGWRPYRASSQRIRTASVPSKSAW